MVISPSELERTIQSIETNKLKEAEERIDEGLTKLYDGIRPITFATEIFGGLRNFVLESLLSKYRTSGWEVRRHSDQRDGDYYQFTPKKEPRQDMRDQYGM